MDLHKSSISIKIYEAKTAENTGRKRITKLGNFNSSLLGYHKSEANIFIHTHTYTLNIAYLIYPYIHICPYMCMCMTYMQRKREIHTLKIDYTYLSSVHETYYKNVLYDSGARHSGSQL